jgi:hypothetical protein
MPSVGIGVAQERDDMPAAPSNHPKSAAPIPSLGQVPEMAGRTSAAVVMGDAPAPAATLRETMVAIVNAVEALEHRAESAPKAVDMQFRVGAEKLALRVELRDDTVVTTFRTDSSEMRSALSHEWRTVTGTVAGGELRIADPVFVANPTGGGEGAFGSLGQGAPHERDRPAPEPARFPLSPDFSESAAPESTPENPSTNSSTSLLQAFA